MYIPRGIGLKCIVLFRQMCYFVRHALNVHYEPLTRVYLTGARIMNIRISSVVIRDKICISVPL